VDDNRGVDIEREHERWSDEERAHGYIRARLRLLTTDEGGRNSPIYSGHRSHWAFPPEVHEERHDAPLTLEGTRVLALGDEAMARLHPLFPELWPEVEPGLRLTMLEGARIVGTAEVVEVVPPVE
jgi:translation elongation factor EF-Tu-like GTPase